MKEQEKEGFGKTPEAVEEEVPHGYPVRPSSSMEKETRTDPGMPYPNTKSKYRTQIAQTPPPEPTPTFPPFISGSSDSRSSNSSHDQTTTPRKGRWYYTKPSLLRSKLHLEWVAPNLTYPKLKPAIRSAGAAWVCVVLFVIPAFEKAMGQASFVVLMASFFSPPSDPFICVLEREILILLLSCISWAWICLCLFLANLSRTYHNPNLTLVDVMSGEYVEAAPSIICGVFIFFGATFFLWLRVRQGPGAYFFACMFALLCLDVTLTTAPLFPSAPYTLTKAIILPLAVHSAVALFFSVVLFPQTMSRKFEECLGEVLVAVGEALGDEGDKLELKGSEGEEHHSHPFPEEPSFLGSRPWRTTTPVSASEEDPASKNPKSSSLRLPLEPTLVPLAAASRLVPSDLSFSRFAPEDLLPLHDTCQRLVGQCTGIQGFWGLIEHGATGLAGAQEGASLPKTPKTPAISRVASQPPSPTPMSIGSRAQAPIGGNPGLDVDGSKRISRFHLAGSNSFQASNSSRSPYRDMESGMERSDERRHLELELGLDSEMTSPRWIRRAYSRDSISYVDAPLNVSREGEHRGGRGRKWGEHLKLEEGQPRSTSVERSPLRSRFDVMFVPRFADNGGGGGHSTDLAAEGMEMETISMGDQTGVKSSTALHAPGPGYGHVQNQTHREPSIFEKWTDRHLHMDSGSPIHCRKGTTSRAQSPTTPPHADLLRQALLNLKLSHATPKARRAEYPVGLFEAQQYQDLEATRLYDPNEESETRRSLEMLRKSCLPLVRVCGAGAECVQKWVGGVRTGRAQWLWASFGFGDKEEWVKRNEAIVREVGKMRLEVGDALDKFRNHDRHLVLEPYRPALEGTGEDEPPPHRYLFHGFVYQYHLIQVASTICEMLDEILRLESLRRTPRVWTPIQRVFQWNQWQGPNPNIDGDEDPDVIEGLNPPPHPKRGVSLSPPFTPGPSDIEAAQPIPQIHIGLPTPRDPDALPPRNVFESFFEFLHTLIASIGTGNVVFAIKAGLLTVVLCLPSFIKSSAQFAYENKFIWAILMGQITLSRFRGDTTLGLGVRIFSTFFGGLVGLVMWYISSGSTRGNPYGLCAICAVCFPLFFFIHLYCPAPPMLHIFFGVTTCLVIGYSYQDKNIPTPAAPGNGWNVFWRRFLLVTCGVMTAFIASLLPPSTTIRRYQRRLLATTASELGNVYCGVVGFAGGKSGDPATNADLIKHIISALLAVRNKLGRAGKGGTVGKNVGYEISLRGRWPAERYQKVVELQIGISYSLSNLISVLQHLDPAWSRAFLRRTRFMDTDFQGDVLAVISLISSSLRTGTPLPHITPCPLIDRFMLKYHGLDVIHRDAEEDYGLPRTLTMDVLKNEQYLIFSVGISTAFGLVNRLDRLMVAVKEIVGEHYYIHGVGPVGVLSSTYGQLGVGDPGCVHAGN